MMLSWSMLIILVTDHETGNSWLLLSLFSLSLLSGVAKILEVMEKKHEHNKFSTEFGLN